MADVVWFTGEQFFDDSGNPLNAGTIEFYDATTSSPRTVYQNSTEATPWGTSLTLNSAGRLTAGVFVPTGAWKYILKNSVGTVVATQDNIPGAVPTVNASFARIERPILTKATNYTVVVGDLGSKINADASGGDITITMLSAVTAEDGGDMVVQNVGATGTVTIATSGGQTINGSTSIKLRAKDDSVDLTADGANWTATITADIRTVLAKTADYTITQADFGRTVTFDATGGARIATFLAASVAGSGFWFRVQKIDSSANAVTADGNLAETINGAATYVLGSQWQIITVECDGANWRTINLPASATTTVAGILETATEAETAARTSTTVAVTPFSAALPPGALFGCVLSNGTDATNDIDITAGKWRDSTDAVNLILTSAVTKRLDAAWAVGTGNGGLDTGAIADTTYHIWLIKRSDTGVVDALFSASATSPTMPASYDFKRRIGSIIRASAAILPFTQNGDTFLLKTYLVSADSANPGASAVTRALNVPLGLVLDALITLGAYLAGATPFAVFANSLAETDVAVQVPATAALTLPVSQGVAYSVASWNFTALTVRTNTSAQIRTRCSATPGATDRIGVITRGWIDTRGKDA